jgi:site-specific recombinase XerD
MRRLQEWMGHADITTTLRYAHFRPRHDDATLVAEAFAVERPVPAVGNPPSS